VLPSAKVPQAVSAAPSVEAIVEDNLLVFSPVVSSFFPSTSPSPGSLRQSSPERVFWLQDMDDPELDELVGSIL